LLVVPASGRKQLPLSLFTLNNPNVLVTALIPGRDKGHFLVRIYNPTGQEQEVLLSWNLLSSVRPAVFTSGLSGQEHRPLSGPLKLAPSSFETLKLEF
jgi:alpha-mannosidase